MCRIPPSPPSHRKPLAESHETFSSATRLDAAGYDAIRCDWICKASALAAEVGPWPTQLRLPKPTVLLGRYTGSYLIPSKSPGAISTDTQPSKITKTGAASFFLRRKAQRWASPLWGYYDS